MTGWSSQGEPMMSSRVAWRAAAVIAFAATAALAVTLSRGAPTNASFVSVRDGSSATHGTPGQRCATSGLRIRLHGGGRTLRYAVEFTNVSAVACTLTGYPSVSAYGASGAPVGNAAGRDTSAAVSQVVLAPGASADASVVANATTYRAARCRPVTAAGLHIVPPGETHGRDVRHALRACSATGKRAPVFLRVLAVEPAPGASVAR